MNFLNDSQASVVVDVQSADSDVVFVATVHAFALLSDTENPLAAVDVAAIVLLLPAIAAISNSLQDPLMVQCSTEDANKYYHEKLVQT